MKTRVPDRQRTSMQCGGRTAIIQKEVVKRGEGLERGLDQFFVFRYGLSPVSGKVEDPYKIK